MTPQEAIDRIAALCDEWPYPNGQAVIKLVRAVLAEVTPEPGGVLDRDRAAEIIAAVPDMDGADWIDAALDRLAACVRPAAGITLTHRERSLLATAADFMEMRLPNGSPDAVDLRALAARLEATP